MGIGTIGVVVSIFFRRERGSGRNGLMEIGLGGEAISMAANFEESKLFRESGYEELKVNVTYVGGVTRQAGLLSFTRVFDAGHYGISSAFPSSYERLTPQAHYTQPSTVSAILARTLSHHDVATGKQSLKHNPKYQSKGPENAWGWRNMLPEMPPIVCSIWDLSTCTQNQIVALGEGKVVIENDVVVEPAL